MERGYMMVCRCDMQQRYAMQKWNADTSCGYEMQICHATKICHWNVQLERGFEVFEGLVVIPDLYDSNPNFKLYLKKVVLPQSSSSSRNVWWRNWGSRCIKVYKFVSDKEGKKNWFVVEILSSSSYDQVFLIIQGFSTFSLFTFKRQCG